MNAHVTIAAPSARARTDANHVESLILALERARPDAMAGKLWDGPRGVAVLNAAFDLFECQELYDEARALGVTFGIEPDGDPIDFMQRGARS